MNSYRGLLVKNWYWSKDDKGKVLYSLKNLLSLLLNTKGPRVREAREIGETRETIEVGKIEILVPQFFSDQNFSSVSEFGYVYLSVPLSPHFSTVNYHHTDLHFRHPSCLFRPVSTCLDREEFFQVYIFQLHIFRLHILRPSCTQYSNRPIPA